MTREDKYKQALERAKVLIDKLESTHIKGFIYHIFPELQENEDERIRKELIELISCMHDADPRKKGWIAWLEKQGEQKNTRKREIDDAYLQGICDAKHEIEKQGKTLDADKVIAWLVANICDFEHYVKLFKKDFGL